MIKSNSYPVMEINLKHHGENAGNIVKKCSELGIGITGDVKGTDSYKNSYKKINEFL